MLNVGARLTRAGVNYRHAHRHLANTDRCAHGARAVDCGGIDSGAGAASTGRAARILGADKNLGTIEAGKVADLVLLDADPLADIRNTRRIWQVVHNGGVVDRPAIIRIFKPDSCICRRLH